MECQANDIRFFLLPRIRKKRRFKIPPLPVSKDVFAAVRRYFRLFMSLTSMARTRFFMRASSTCAESSSFTFMLFFTC